MIALRPGTSPRTFVFVPGAGSSKKEGTLKPLADWLRKQGHRVYYVPSNRYWPRRGVSALDHQAHTVIAFLNKHYLTNVTLVGHSLGAAVAVRVATVTHRVRSVRLLCPAGAYNQWYAWLAYRFTGKCLSDVIQAFAHPEREVRQLTRQGIRGAGYYFGSLSGFFLTFREGWQLRRDTTLAYAQLLAEHKVPVRFILAERDRLFPMRYVTKALGARPKGIEVVKVAAGHDAHYWWRAVVRHIL